MKDQIELDWKIQLKRAKFFTLLGQARLQMGDEAGHNYLLDALKSYGKLFCLCQIQFNYSSNEGVWFPRRGLTRKILMFRYKLKNWLRFYIWSNRFHSNVEDDVAEYCNNVAECLSFLCEYYVVRIIIIISVLLMLLIQRFLFFDLLSLTGYRPRQSQLIKHYECFITK